jgi:branched-chain amino acid transport system permease protein
MMAFLSGLLPALAAEGILPVTPVQAGVLRYILVGLLLMLLVAFRPQGLLGDKKEMTFVK